MLKKINSVHIVYFLVFVTAFFSVWGIEKLESNLYYSSMLLLVIFWGLFGIYYTFNSKIFKKDEKEYLENNNKAEKKDQLKSIVLNAAILLIAFLVVVIVSLIKILT